MLTKTALVLILALSPFYAMASDATHTMAGILLSLNHFPSDADKAALSSIEESETASYNEKMLAGVIAGIAHKVSDDDREELEELLDDEDIEAGVRVIANALLGINHKVSDGDAAALKKLK